MHSATLLAYLVDRFVSNQALIPDLVDEIQTSAVILKGIDQKYCLISDVSKSDFEEVIISISVTGKLIDPSSQGSGVQWKSE
jgi:hypothetical protein